MLSRQAESQLTAGVTSGGRKALFALATAVVALLGVELATRVVFSFVAGHSLLLYGLGSTEPTQKPGMLFPHIDRMDWHRVLAADDREKAFLEHETGPYSRYYPHQYKRNRDEYGHLNDIRINNLGLRGPDVSPSKPAGVFRVITLGASSTFGYRNRDHETYPRYLESDLNEALARRRALEAAACPGIDRFEVFNFGIPHLNAAQIRSLFAAEGLPLDPDLVSFYEGANETRLLTPPAAQRLLSALGQRLLAVRFAQSALQSELASFSAAELDAQIVGLSEGFLSSVAAIADDCAERGVAFLVASQGARSFLVPREELPFVSYAEEAARVRAKLADEGSIGLKELVFLMHARLMADLRPWALEHGVGFVDAMGALARAGERDELLSWVHLSAQGNRIVAAALAEAIFERACLAAEPQPRGPAGGVQSSSAARSELGTAGTKPAK